MFRRVQLYSRSYSTSLLLYLLYVVRLPIPMSLLQFLSMLQLCRYSMHCWRFFSTVSLHRHCKALQERESKQRILSCNAARTVTAARARNGGCRRKKIQFPGNRAFTDPRDLTLCRVTSVLFDNWKPRSLRNSFTHTPPQDYAIIFAKMFSPFLAPFLAFLRSIITLLYY